MCRGKDWPADWCPKDVDFVASVYYIETVLRMIIEVEMKRRGESS